MDVVIDGLMVQESRKDPQSGSEDLQAFSWAIAGVGGVAGYVTGGLMTDAGHAWEAIYTTFAFGIIMMVAGCLLDKELESDDKEVTEMAGCKRLKHTCREI